MGTTEDRITHMRRWRSFESFSKLPQSYSKFWILFRTHNYPKHKVFAKLGNCVLEVHGNSYIYMPAFTLAEWWFLPGSYECEAFTSYAVGDSALPDYPLIFPACPNEDIQSYSNIADLLKRYDQPNILEKQKPSYVAERTKLFLDDYFAEPLCMNEIAHELRMSYATMRLGFKKYYGVPPIAYRNVLRTFEALRLIKNNETVTQAGIAAGFTGLTQFNQHFHRVLGGSPSLFSK